MATLPDNHALEGRLRPLRKVVVVFKTHFDLGFTDLPDRVMALYTGPMFQAVQGVMAATANEPDNLQYKWTLPAWPMKYLLHNSAVPEETRAAARRLVEEGRLVWHAWPFTTHTAFCGLEDLVRGLHISRSLSEEFGIFFFQAEDGIRAWSVTGVQTCALPILMALAQTSGCWVSAIRVVYPPALPPVMTRRFGSAAPDLTRLMAPAQAS